MSISPYDFYQPLSEDEREVAQHEAAHAVMALAVPNDCVLDLAATVAGAMTGLPAHQKAIHALADFLTENRRRKATGIQASVIVRPFIPARMQWIKQH